MKILLLLLLSINTAFAMENPMTNATCSELMNEFKHSPEQATDRWAAMINKMSKHPTLIRYDKVMRTVTAEMESEDEIIQFALATYYRALHQTGIACKVRPDEPMMTVFMEALDNVVVDLIKVE